MFKSTTTVISEFYAAVYCVDRGALVETTVTAISLRVQLVRQPRSWGHKSLSLPF